LVHEEKSIFFHITQSVSLPIIHVLSWIVETVASLNVAVVAEMGVFLAALVGNVWNVEDSVHMSAY